LESKGKIVHNLNRKKKIIFSPRKGSDPDVKRRGTVETGGGKERELCKGRKKEIKFLQRMVNTPRGDGGFSPFN